MHYLLFKKRGKREWENEIWDNRCNIATSAMVSEVGHAIFALPFEMRHYVNSRDVASAGADHRNMLLFSFRTIVAVET